LQVDDGNGGVTPQTFSVEVVSAYVGHAPVITSPAPRTVDCDPPRFYQATATDADNNPLVWSLDVAPDGAWINPYTGLLIFDWSSVEGKYLIRLRVTDSHGLYDTQDVVGEVVQDVGPTIRSVPVTQTTVNQLYSKSLHGLTSGAFP
jgi:hypothetical protein